MNEDPTYLPEWKRPDELAIDRFARALADAHVTVTVRRSKGPDASAACGQLKGSHRGSEEAGASGRQVGSEELPPLPRIGELRRRGGLVVVVAMAGAGDVPDRAARRERRGELAHESRGHETVFLAVHEEDRSGDAEGGADRIDGVESAAAGPTPSAFRTPATARATAHRLVSATSGPGSRVARERYCLAISLGFPKGDSSQIARMPGRPAANSSATDDPAEHEWMPMRPSSRPKPFRAASMVRARSSFSRYPSVKIVPPLRPWPRRSGTRTL